MDDDSAMVHRYLPGAGPLTLLLLHGTGGNESDLLGLGRALDESAHLLSPRGRVLEDGMPRFFRRLAVGVFDVEDLVARTHELADFVRDRVAAYDLDGGRVVACGYSNGANIAASLLLLRPEVLAGAILLHAMPPFAPRDLPSLAGKPVLLTAGRRDPMVSPEQAESLEMTLRQAGAGITLEWMPGGHELTQSEIEVARTWLAGRRQGWSR